MSAIEQGLLEESHYLDVKASIPLGAAKNRELARDLASFAVDGGALLIGVAEGDAARLELQPVELAGLPERIEQVARSIPDPPIPVTCTSIPASDNLDHGYLLVEVPSTGLAPHMVDGVYMGRGDKTKVRLSDAEVVRLHEARERTQDLAAQVLAAYVRRDPVPTDLRQQAHLFVVAAPVRPRPEMLLEARVNGRWHQTLLNLLDSGAYRPPLNGDSPFSPDLRSVGEFARRSDGAALTYNLTDARTVGRYRQEHFDEDAVELEVTEEGVLRVLSTRLSDNVSDDRGQEVFEEVLPYFVRRTVGMAAQVSDYTGYSGPWVLGVAATGIAGLSVYGSGRRFTSQPARFDAGEERYERYTTSSTAELHQSPGAVTQRLAGRFLRSIGFDASPGLSMVLSDPIPEPGDTR